ncbi:MAG TPA: TrkH family potassium uptake protein [Methylomirabilota bacterium]|nr:TrkH family potassium uptake protein [Methylomirabilota bacterium]
MIDIRPVLFVIGLFGITSGPLLMLCALVDLASDNPDWQVFALSAVITVGFGGLLSTATWTGSIRLTLRQGFLLTVLSWAVMSFIGAIPLYLSSLPISFAGAFFEAMSGFTTTGSTVIVGLDGMPPGLLLWRGLMQWVGGLGVIALGIVLLPFLRISGMQLFRLESSDVSEKATARLVVLIRQIGLLYLAITMVGIFSLLALGATPMDAVVHAFTAVSTGGFSTHDASAGFFDRPSQAALLVMMITGALTFPLLLLVFHGRPDVLWRDEQIRFYLLLIASIVSIIVLWRVAMTDADLVDAAWGTLFNVVSVITTTGYASENYLEWGPFPETAFLLFTLIGGCTGSTSGGIKPYRLLVLGRALRGQLQTRIHPHRMTRVLYNGRIVDDEVVRSVFAFLGMLLAALVLFTAAVSACGVDPITAFSGVMQALANVGPGVGPIIGPAGNFATMPEPALWILSAAMLLGRLEVVAVLVVISPAFWRL